MNDAIAILKHSLSEPQFKSVSRFLPDLIFRFDEQGMFLDFYSVQEHLLAYPPEAIIGKNISDLFPPAIADPTREHIQYVMKTNSEISFQYSLPLSGEEQHFEALIIPSGKRTATAFIKDITNKKKIEIEALARNQTIEESERKFRLLAENLPGAVYLCNNDETFSMLYLNDQIVEITGYTASDFLAGRIDFSRLYFPEDAPQIYQTVEACLAKKTSFHLEYRIVHQSGEMRWIEEFGAGVFNENKLVCLEGYLQDITVRKAAEKKIVEQNQALVKTNSELDKFVYSASHDLRSPLSSVLGLINLAEKKPMDEELRFFFKLIRERIFNLDNFIKEITYYSQNARLDVEEAEVDLFGLVNECYEGLKHAEEAEGLQFEVTIPVPYKLVTDGRRLRVIINNLLSNAIKYSDKKKAYRYIRVNAGDSELHHIVRVEDNGVGIEKQYLDKIFDMFYRASEKSQGSGLGLYIAKEAVTKLNGVIEVRSEFSKGSEFWVLLPKKK
jgi:PAS domain S-box-containing protein